MSIIHRGLIPSLLVGATCVACDTLEPSAPEPTAPAVIEAPLLIGSPTETQCQLAPICLGNVCVGVLDKPNGTACSDGNACTVNDACYAGRCSSGSALSCDDGNACTDDACLPATGCASTNNTASCDDGDDCTGDDACSDGECVGDSLDVDLLIGGLQDEGWSVLTQGPATLSYGLDFTQIATSTNPGASSGGQMLIAFRDAITSGVPFTLEAVVAIDRVAPHNQYDAAAAIMTSLTGSVGTQADRGQMLYLDPARVGFADDAQSAAATVADGAYHTIRFEVGPDNVAHVSVDGVPKLSRPGFATNGTVAIGDHTNDPRVDAAMRIRSVKLLCQ